MSHALITHQNIGDEFSGTYYVQSAYIKQTVQNKDYTDLLLRDRSGARPVKHWGVVKDLTKGCWVFIAGSVDEFQGLPSIKAKNIEIVNEPDDLDDYIPIYDGCDELTEQFDTIRDMINSDETCCLMIDEVYRSGSFFDKFIRCPGSDGPSYGKRGGLLASVVRIASHSLDAGKSYGLTEAENCIMLTAALLCRVGAADAYEFEDCMPVMTKRGILLGVPNLTMTRVSSALRRVVGSAKKSGKSVDQETIIKILHAIVAANKSCGVQSMTKEAMILQGIVELDSEVVDALDFINSDVNTEEEFTAFDTRMRRRYYRG
jgi:23S rRNA maturation-related 3'-5' exoribonuclease YhaM